MIFSLPNFKNFAKEHTAAFVSGIILVLVIAGAMYAFLTAKPDYRNLYDTLASGNYTEVIEKGESLLQRNPDEIALIHILASAYLSQGVVTNDRKLWVDKAIDLLTKSITEGEDNAESERLIGYGHFLLKNYDEARKHYEKAANLDGDSALIWADLAQLYEVQGDFARSNSLYDKALALDSSNALANLGKLRKLMREGKGSIASSKAEVLLDSGTTRDALSRATLNQIIGLVALEKRSFARAGKYFTEAVRQNPTSVASLTGLALAIIGDIPNHPIKDMVTETELPKTLAERAIAIEPNYTYGYVVLNKVAKIRGEEENAKDYAAKIREVASKDASLSIEDKKLLSKEFGATTPAEITNLKIISIKKLDSSSVQFGIKDISE